MASKQNQDGWDDATSTFPSEDYSMKTWGDETNPDHHEQQTEEESKSLEQLAQEYLADIERKQGAEDPFDYTPWIAALPMPLVKEIEQGLRVNGLKLRKQIQADLKRNPLMWDALRRPASFHNAHRSLAEMLVNIPQPDHSQFTELGDGHVHMSLATMEKYLYPTLLPYALSA
jgi:hypothetical protein